MFLTLLLPRAQRLAVHATVAWASRTPPYRTGVSFPRSGSEERAGLTRAMLGADPRLAHQPPPLRPNARLRLGRPPGRHEVFSRDERTVLRAARDRRTAIDVLRGAGSGGGLRRALFELRVRGMVREGLGPEPDPEWAPVLGDEPAPSALSPDPELEQLGRPIRPARAQEYLEVARGERAAGHLAAAVEWLQEAAAAAPQDPEIATALDGMTTTMETPRSSSGASPGEPRS